MSPIYEGDIPVVQSKVRRSLPATRFQKEEVGGTVGERRRSSSLKLRSSLPPVGGLPEQSDRGRSTSVQSLHGLDESTSSVNSRESSNSTLRGSSLTSVRERGESPGAMKMVWGQVKSHFKEDIKMMKEDFGLR